MNRGNTNSGNYVFNLKDAANVTFDSLELTGAEQGLRIDLASNDVTLSNSVMRGNTFGVNILPTAQRTVIVGNEFNGTGAANSEGINVQGTTSASSKTRSIITCRKASNW